MRTSLNLAWAGSALALACLAAIARADTQSRCQRDKLGAVSRGVKGVFACPPKDLQGVTLGTFDATCLGEASPKFLAGWSRAIAKAHAQDVSCFNAPSAGAVGQTIVSAASDASAAIRAGFAPADDADPAAVALLNSLMKAAEAYLASTLAAEARHADKPDADKLAAALAKALQTLENKADGASQKAAAEGVDWMGSASAVADALDLHVQGLVLGITTNPAFPVGAFVDSGVAGAEFAPGLDAGPNLTLPGGLFPVTDATMTFAIGGIELGESAVSATGFVTPVSLVPGADDETDPVVTNMARFLQTIDDDGKTANGISIPAAVREQVAGLSLDFSDEAAVVALAETLTAFTAKGARPAVTAEQAQDHLQQALLGVFAGAYSGTFDGDDFGTWQVTISGSGKISGSGVSNQVGKIGIHGHMSSSGGLDAVAGGASTGAVYAGTIDLQGNVSGLWENAKFGEDGTFTGTLQP